MHLISWFPIQFVIRDLVGKSGHCFPNTRFKYLFAEWVMVSPTLGCHGGGRAPCPLDPLAPPHCVPRPGTTYLFLHPLPNITNNLPGRRFPMESLLSYYLTLPSFSSAFENIGNKKKKKKEMCLQV